jgi:hypothetical protein
MTYLDKKDIIKSKILVFMGLLILIVISQNACVRIANQTNQSRFINNNDGTVTDNQTGFATIIYFNNNFFTGGNGYEFIKKNRNFNY